MRPRPILPKFLAVVLAAATTTVAASAGRFLTTDEFLQQAFPAGMTCGAAPSSESLIVGQELRDAIEAALDRDFKTLRIKYWSAAATTAWIFDEIGRTEPITIGVVVTDGKVDMVRVLVYRESRGSEVRYPYFTEQFVGAQLDEKRTLDRHIDGITGATLSVNAVNRAVRLATFLAARSNRANGTMPYARECPGATEP